MPSLNHQSTLNPYDFHLRVQMVFYPTIPVLKISHNSNSSQNYQKIALCRYEMTYVRIQEEDYVWESISLEFFKIQSKLTKSSPPCHLKAHQ